MAKRANIRMFIKTNWCKIEYDLYSFVIDCCVACVAEPTHRDYFPLSSVLLHHTFAVRLRVKVFELKWFIKLHWFSLNMHTYFFMLRWLQRTFKIFIRGSFGLLEGWGLLVYSTMKCKTNQNSWKVFMRRQVNATFIDFRKGK